MEKPCIYLLTIKCGEFDRILVGQTINLKNRKKVYKSACLKNSCSNPKLQACVNKYGWNAVSFKILKECDEEQLDDLEKLYIKNFNTFGTFLGMNLTSGGEHGKKFGTETKALWSNQRKGRVFSELWRENLCLARKGRKPALGMKHTQETKIKIALKNGGVFFMLKHEDGKIVSGINKSDISRLIGLSRRSIGRILNNGTSIKGWSLVSLEGKI